MSKDTINTKRWILTQEQIKEIYNTGVKEGEERSGNFEWGIRRTDIKFEQNEDITLPNPVEIPDFELADKVHIDLLNTEHWCTQAHKDQIRDTVTSTLKLIIKNK